MSKRPIVLMCAKTQGPLADKVMEACPDLIPAKMQWNTFQSMVPDFVIQNPELIRGSHVVFIADASSAQHVMEQWAVLCALQHYRARSLTIFIPYFPGTLDRIDVPGRIVWAKSVARLFSNIPPLHGSGPPQIIIYDIHAEQEPHFFGDGVANVNLSALPHMLREIRGTWTFNAIAFPDAGAKKRFEDLAPALPRIICGKERRGNERIVTIIEGDPRGRRVLLIDDLIMSGGTLIKSGDVMINGGALEVRAVAAHPVLPGTAIQRLVAATSIKRFYVSDSIPIGEPPPKIEVISLAPLIAEEIRLIS